MRKGDIAEPCITCRKQRAKVLGKYCPVCWKRLNRGKIEY